MGIIQDVGGQVLSAQKYAENSVSNMQSFMDALKELSAGDFKLSDVGKMDDTGRVDFTKIQEDISHYDPGDFKPASSFMQTPNLGTITPPGAVDSITVDSFNNPEPTVDYTGLPGALTVAAPSLDSKPEMPGMPDKQRVTLPTPPLINMPGLPSAITVNLPSLNVVPFTSTAPQPNPANLPISIPPPNFTGVAPAPPVSTLPSSLSFATTTPIIPSPPIVNVGVFDGAFDFSNNITPPSASFSFAELSYASALKDSVTAKLLNDIANGGYGIDPIDEQRLWDATRERELSSSRSMVEESKRQMASYGWSLPSGIMLRNIKEGNQKVISATSLINRDISIKRADLYKENRQFAISKSLELEQLTVNFHGSMMERMLNAQKAMLQYGIDKYNAQVKQYELKIEAYKTKVYVYETQMKGELAKSEIYKAQIDGVSSLFGIEKIKADVEIAKYDGQIKGELAKVEVYKAQMDGFNTIINTEKIKADVAVAVYDGNIKGELAKVEVYKAQMDGFNASANVNKTLNDAKITEFDGKMKGELAKVDVFKAQMSGAIAQSDMEKTKADIYKSQVAGIEAIVQGYKAEVEATKIQADIEMTKVEIFKAQVAAYAERVKAKQAEFEGYKSKIAGNAAQVDAYAASAKAYEAKCNGYLAKTQVSKLKLDRDIAFMNSQIAKFEKVDFAMWDASLRSYIENERIKAEHYKAKVAYFGASGQIATSLAQSESAQHVGDGQVTVAKHTSNIAKVEAELRGIIESAKVRQAAAQAGASVYGNLAAAALSTVHAQMQEQVSDNINWNHNSQE